MGMCLCVMDMAGDFHTFLTQLCRFLRDAFVILCVVQICPPGTYQGLTGQTACLVRWLCVYALSALQGVDVIGCKFACILHNGSLTVIG